METRPGRSCVIHLVDTTTRAVLATQVATVPYPPEYRRFQPDLQRLKDLARATGGRLYSDADEFTAMLSRPPVTYHSLRWPLVVLLLALFTSEAVLRACGRI